MDNILRSSWRSSSLLIFSASPLPGELLFGSLSSAVSSCSSNHYHFCSPFFISNFCFSFPPYVNPKIYIVYLILEISRGISLVICKARCFRPTSRWWGSVARCQWHPLGTCTRGRLPLRTISTNWGFFWLPLRSIWATFWCLRPWPLRYDFHILFHNQNCLRNPFSKYFCFDFLVIWVDCYFHSS